MQVYTKLHGTTADSFKIGSHSERITLTGVTVGATTSTLLTSDNQKYTADTTVYFTAFIIGIGSNDTAASYEIKGCYIQGTNAVTGTVVTTYVDSAGFTEPTVSFNNTGELTVECTGVAGDTVNWTASIDFVMV